MAEERYLAWLAGGGSLWVELQNLLDHSLVGLSHADIRQLVLEKNVVTKRTLANCNKVWRKLVERYSMDPGDTGFVQFLQLYYRETSIHQRALLAYLLFNRNNDLARRISLDWLAPQLYRSGALLDRKKLRQYFDDLCDTNEDVAAWAETTKAGFLKQYLGAIRDFGLAEGRGKKIVTKPVVGSNVVLYALQLARMQGLPPREMLRCQWFQLLGVDMDWVISKLFNMNSEGLTKFRIQGDVVELQFNVDFQGDN